MDGYEQMILLGIGLGTLVRMIELRIDYRQYPGYPHGYVVHSTLGFIAAALGALVIPALLEENYVAVTILGAAAQQFQNIRTMERDFLTEIETTELVPRGIAYIENIAKVFEARNYLAMMTAFFTTIGYYFLNLIGGLIVGGLTAYFLDKIMVQKTVGNIANIRVADLEFSGPTGSNIGVEGVVMMNVGLKEALEQWKKAGIGIAIEPKDDDARATLANIGQRQAIVHDVANQLGVKLDIGVVDYTPLARLNLDTGRVYMIIIPIEPDEECVKQAVSSTPILEEARRRPLQSKAGSAAAD
ncbi:YIEGIA family protein [Natroniella acetigena]|uniref:YIEGIA family protein n=1 Tax=Natroniella acetigena TaxID=52004 RepID=UPI00200A8969|nr:YIEGIA family protein [Natroniella acetigena]MCK8826545.1 YIEGIA family protein [Natroniella acetigena]